MIRKAISAISVLLLTAGSVFAEGSEVEQKNTEKKSHNPYSLFQTNLSDPEQVAKLDLEQTEKPVPFSYLDIPKEELRPFKKDLDPFDPDPHYEKFRKEEEEKGLKKKHISVVDSSSSLGGKWRAKAKIRFNRKYEIGVEYKNKWKAQIGSRGKLGSDMHFGAIVERKFGAPPYLSAADRARARNVERRLLSEGS